jgi:hypothetical protein
MQDRRNQEQPGLEPLDLQRVIDESRKALYRLRRLVRWRTLEVMRSGKK